MNTNETRILDSFKLCRSLGRLSWESTYKSAYQQRKYTEGFEFPKSVSGWIGADGDALSWSWWKWSLVTVGPDFQWLAKEDQEQSGRDWLNGKRIFDKHMENLGKCSRSGCLPMQEARNRWSYSYGDKMLWNSPLFELIAEAFTLLQASKIGDKKALLFHYLYSFQGDSWYNFRVFCRFPVSASMHFWRYVHFTNTRNLAWRRGDAVTVILATCVCAWIKV